MSFHKGDVVYVNATHAPQSPNGNTRFIVDSEVKDSRVSVCGYTGPKIDGIPDCTPSGNTLCYKYGIDPTRDPSLPLMCNMVWNTADLSSYDKCNLCPQPPGPIS